MEPKDSTTSSEAPHEFLLKELFLMQGKQEKLDVGHLHLDRNSLFPLYLYPENHEPRVPNLNMEIVTRMAQCLELQFVSEKQEEGNVCLANSEEVRDDFRLNFTPEDIADYLYAVLNSPTFSNEQRANLALSTIKIPYPTPDSFWEQVKQGRVLKRQQDTQRKS